MLKQTQIVWSTTSAPKRNAMDILWNLVLGELCHALNSCYTNIP
jgi:hypothetical protein